MPRDVRVAGVCFIFRTPSRILRALQFVFYAVDGENLRECCTLCEKWKYVDKSHLGIAVRARRRREMRRPWHGIRAHVHFTHLE